MTNQRKPASRTKPFSRLPGGRCIMGRHPLPTWRWGYGRGGGISDGDGEEEEKDADCDGREMMTLVAIVMVTTILF
jgi:hypothetical protein